MNSFGSVNLNVLQYMRVLLTERQVSRAAQKAGLSQPGMSHVLKELRQIFQDPLLVKVNKGWEPTEKALLILGQLEQGFGFLEKVVHANLPFSPQTEDRQFRIICTDYVGMVLVPEFVHRLRGHFPGISLDLLPWASVADPILAERADLIIGFCPDTLPAQFREDLLFEEEYLCMFRKGHPRIKNRLTLEGFLAEDHAIVREQDGAIGVVNVALQKLGRTRKVVLEVPSFLTFPFIVSQTDLVITTTSRNIKLFEPFLPLRSLPSPLDLPRVPVKQRWHVRTDSSPAHQWLRQMVREVAIET